MSNRSPAQVASDRLNVGRVDASDWFARQVRRFDEGSHPWLTRRCTPLTCSPGHADWPRRRAVIRNGLHQLRPDVVTLQETGWGYGYDQASDLPKPAVPPSRVIHILRS
jgi:hypothetical protein